MKIGFLFADRPLAARQEGVIQHLPDAITGWNV